jgi:8-oxo-dGTP diphosphatase
MPHINELIDFTVEVFIVHNNKVLLRKHDKYGIWLSVGGHIEPHEDSNQAAIREVKEEVGLDIELLPTSKILDSDKETYKHLIAPAFMNRHLIKNKHEHVTLIHFAKSYTNEIKQLAEKELSKECKWFSLEELQRLNEGITKTVKNYAKQALQTANSTINNE